MSSAQVAVPSSRVAAWRAWWRSPLARRAVALALGLGVGAACPYLPAYVQPVCHAVAGLFYGS